MAHDGQKGYVWPMDVTEVMGELERLGTEQNRKVYRRHGMTDPLFGVSFAHMNALEKRIKRDHELAEALWATGNADARTLAVTIADPERFTWDKLEAWLDGLRSPVLIDLLMKRVALKTPFARDAMARWTASNDEWIGRAGWTLLGLLATEDPSLPDSVFEERLSVIEASIRRARNRVREGMNNALISIGARNEPLRGMALTAARRIGKVEIDHGETNCKTPAATAYIEKIWARKPDRRACREAGRGRRCEGPAKAAAKPARAAAKPARAAAKRALARQFRPTRRPAPDHAGCAVVNSSSGDPSSSLRVSRSTTLRVKIR